MKRKKSQSSKMRKDGESVVPIKAIRLEMEMTQVEFAVAIGCSPTSVSFWERGLSEPQFTVRQFKRLLKASGKSVEELPDYLSASPED